MFKYINNMIETERLILCRFKLSDADKVAEMCNDYDVYKGTLALPHPYTKECAENWILRHNANFENEYYFDFAITDKKTNELYGCIGMSPNAKNNTGELGYWIGKEYWGCGYATEAVEAMIRFGFEIKGYDRIYARHFASNPASGKVLQKSGMVYEGTLKDHIFKIDKYEDVVHYGVVNTKNMLRG